MRRHGFQCPLDPYQVGSWILFAGLVTGCYALYVPMVENEAARWTLFSVYSVLVAFVIALAFITSRTDPSDPGLDGPTEGDYYCAHCQANVGRCSKHCRACDRCVDGFDHHCKWLNNCIGAKNYKQFFFLVAFTVAMLVTQFGWGIYLFSRCFYDGVSMGALINARYNGVNFTGYKVALGAYLVILLASILMLGELLFFHIILVFKDMTTYDYIISQRDQKAQAASQTRPRSGNLLGCKNNQIHDESQPQRRKVKVHINPCAALMTAKPPQQVRQPAGNVAPGALSEHQAPQHDKLDIADSDCPIEYDKSAIYGKAVVSESSDCSSTKFAENALPGLSEDIRAAVELVPPPLSLPDRKDESLKASEGCAPTSCAPSPPVRGTAQLPPLKLPTRLPATTS